MAIPFRYNLRSLRVRWLTTALTTGGITLVVATFVALMALATGLSRAMTDSAEPRHAILLYRGSISEAMSRITIEQFQALRFLPQVAAGARGAPLASLESLIQIHLPKRSGGESMVLLRGMRPIGLEVHEKATLVEGRWFAPATESCVVGKGIAERHAGMQVGGTLTVGTRRLRIVGHFAAGGSTLESEIWADLDVVVGAAGRDWYNSVTVVLRDAAQFPEFQETVRDDPRIDLGARTAADYHADQAGGAAGFRTIGLVVCFFMAIGASLAEMNTMYAAIGSRTREIATLRTLGFSRRAILASFLAESVLLAVPGGILGCLIGSRIDGFTMSLISLATVSEVSFQFLVTPSILAAAFAFSVSLGLLGGLLPALRAARMPVLEALRKV